MRTAPWAQGFPGLRGPPLEPPWAPTPFPSPFQSLVSLGMGQGWDLQPGSPRVALRSQAASSSLGPIMMEILASRGSIRGQGSQTH